MQMTKGVADGDVVRRILGFPLISEAPLRLTEQVEWHEFIPLGFLLVQSFRPRRIIEVGTAIGDSYLSLCQAVKRCDLSAKCVCIPLSRPAGRGEAHAGHFENFRAYHDALYSEFSEICTADERHRLLDRDDCKFDLMHIVNSGSIGELGSICSTWFPRLRPTGVVLISGRGQLEGDQLKSALKKTWSGYCSRVLQMDHWVVALSIRPIGILRELLLSSEHEFAPVMSLLKLLGHQVLAQRETNALRREIQELAIRCAAAEESEMDAHIRFGELNLRLDEEWMEKEEYRKQLQSSANLSDDATAGESSAPAAVDTELFADVKRMLLRIRQRYSNDSRSAAMAGRDFWDDCGRSVVSSILSKQERLIFPKPSHPKVSVIVVLRNKAHLSVLCLCALLLETAVDYELIIVDNGSSDETRDVLKLIDSAIVIRNAENLGFGQAVMQAAACASGEFLCLLNNDALLERGSLATLLRVFAERPIVGAVGGKIRLANGRLQEAGCIVWRDGRVRQWGREDDPRRPQYSFRRPVDYCSGVFLATPLSLFHALGGLEERYAPAYYEDVDYCMKLWDAKRPVIYEPRAVTYHYEGASSTNSVGTREMIRMNHRRFTDRWRGALRAHQIDRPEMVVRARIAAGSESRRCLYLLGDLPGQLGKLHMDPQLRHVRSLVRDGNVVTCLYERRNNYGDFRGDFPVDVELRSLDSMQTDELEDYCKASNVIIVAANESPNAQIKRVLDENSTKIAKTD